jgi:hypothetical protein
MIATYTSNGGRRFRYYVCQAARQSGWHSCPTKSVAAALIEDTVVAQLRTALSGEDTRQQLQITETDWEHFLEGDARGLVVGVVEHIGYDGTTGAGDAEAGLERAAGCRRAGVFRRRHSRRRRSATHRSARIGLHELWRWPIGWTNWFDPAR